MEKKKKLGRDPFSKEALPYIQNTKTERKPPVINVTYEKDYRELRDKRGRKRKLPIRESTGAGLPMGWIRATFIVREEYLTEIKKHVKVDKPLKAVIDNIFADFLNKDKTER